MKRWISVLLSVVLLMGLLPLGVAAANDGVFEYEVYEEGVYIYSCTAEIAGHLEIPAYIDGQPVVSIESGAFSWAEDMTSVTLPDTLKYLYHGAFGHCSALTSVTIPAGVEYIDEGVFTGCTSLTDIYVEAGNEYYCDLDGVLFSYWEDTLIQFPAGRSGSYTVPADVKEIGDSAFYGCENMTAVILPEGLWEIGRCAFSECYGLTSMVIPDSVVVIDDNAFEYCTDMTSLILGDGVEYIGVYAISDCDSLVSLTIPDSVVTLEYGAVSYNENLSYLSIGSGVEYIGEGAFWANLNLVSVEISPVNAHYCVDGGLLFNKDRSTLILCPAASGITTYTVPASVKRIEEEAFYSCTDLTNITIPQTVESVGENAFAGTEYFHNGNNWENGVLYIGNYLVDANEEEISGAYTVKAGTKAIADRAFEYCSNLTALTIPNSVNTIGDYAFISTGLTTVSIAGNGATVIGEYAFLYCSSLTSLTIGNGVKEIGVGAFEDCTVLPSVTIPNSVTTIGEYAFSWCYELGNISIGNGVTTIGEYAFESTGYADNEANWEDGALYIGTYLVAADWGMESDVVIKDGTTVMSDRIFEDRSWITSITLPESVINVAYAAFASCYNLTEVTIPSSVVSIDDYAFADCYNLTDVHYGGTETTKDAMDISDYGNWPLDGATWHYNGCNHEYDNSCDADCNLCGAVREGVSHAYTDACDESCNNCGATRTPPHAYDHFHDGECNLCGATRTVAELQAGDANGDGKVNVRDLGILQQYVNGWDVGDLGTDAACDVNGDGKVNVRDIGLMQQYLNGWDVQLKLPA